MKVTITIETKANKCSSAFSDEVHALLPDREQIEKFRAGIVSAVLPVKFLMRKTQTQNTTIEFDY